MAIIFERFIVESIATIPLCLGSSTSTTWGAPDFLSERDKRKLGHIQFDNIDVRGMWNFTSIFLFTESF